MKTFFDLTVYHWAQCINLWGMSGTCLILCYSLDQVFIYILVETSRTSSQVIWVWKSSVWLKELWWKSREALIANRELLMLNRQAHTFIGIPIWNTSSASATVIHQIIARFYIWKWLERAANKEFCMTHGLQGYNSSREGRNGPNSIGCLQYRKLF